LPGEYAGLRGDGFNAIYGGDSDAAGGGMEGGEGGFGEEVGGFWGGGIGRGGRLVRTVIYVI
jgi:hypothetical protein